MKKYVIILGLLFGFNEESFAHTGYPDTLTCPVCESPVVFYRTMSMTTFGGSRDFEKKGAIGYYYEEKINACKTCYYSGYLSAFDTTFTDAYIDSIKVITNKYKGKPIDDVLECEIAADIKMLRDFKNDHIASIYLVASYFLRNDSTQVDKRKELQTKTAEFLIKAIENKEYENDEIATIQYLIGEMYRRIGLFEKAIIYYDFAIGDKNGEDWVKEIAEEQKELALKEDDNNDI